MAVWGIGAYYSGSKKKDKTADFINDGRAYIGWRKEQAPVLHNMFDSIRPGDIIYIKSYSIQKKKLKIKAVGIVTDTKKDTHKLDELGTGIKVSWKKNFEPFEIERTTKEFKNNVFYNTLYEEFDQNIIERLIDEIL